MENHSPTHAFFHDESEILGEDSELLHLSIKEEEMDTNLPQVKWTVLFSRKHLLVHFDMTAHPSFLFCPGKKYEPRKKVTIDLHWEGFEYFEKSL